jgi:hypothetical protein
MDFVTILRELWDRRAAVCVAAVLAIVVGLVVAYHISVFPPKIATRQYQVGLGSTTLLLDTPDSQVVDLSPRSADSLNARAALIANLMATAPVKAAIAQRAGVSPNDLDATVSSTSGTMPQTAPSTQLAARATTATTGTTKKPSHTLTIRPDGNLPIVLVETQAPDARQAARLADAAVSALNSYLTSVASIQQVPAKRRLIVKQLGSAQAADVVRGPQPLMALLAAAVFFALACGAIIGVSAAAREWRRAGVSPVRQRTNSSRVNDSDTGRVNESDTGRVNESDTGRVNGSDTGRVKGSGSKFFT